MIVYAIFASSAGQTIKVEDFFLAGIGPGLLIGAMLAAYCLVIGLKKGESFTQPDFGSMGLALREGFWSLTLPVVILGGIYSGIFTANEAAAVSVIYSLVVELCIHRELTVDKLPSVLAEAALLMGSLMVIFAMAVGLNQLLSDLEIPVRAANWIMSFEMTPFTFLLILNGFLLLVGCLMDIMSAIMILVPLLAPMALLCGIDPMHLGIIFIVNLELGYLTPPMGLNLFVSSSIFNQSLGQVIRAVIPFTLTLMVSVLVVTYVPTVSMGPVNLLDDEKSFYVPFPDKAACDIPELPERDDDDADVGDPADIMLKNDGNLKKLDTEKANSLQDIMNSSDYADALDALDMDEDDEDDEDEDEDDEDDELLDQTQNPSVPPSTGIPSRVPDSGTSTTP